MLDTGDWENKQIHQKSQDPGFLVLVLEKRGPHMEGKKCQNESHGTDLELQGLIRMPGFQYRC